MNLQMMFRLVSILTFHNEIYLEFWASNDFLAENNKNMEFNFLLKSGNDTISHILPASKEIILRGLSPNTKYEIVMGYIDYGEFKEIEKLYIQTREEGEIVDYNSTSNTETGTVAALMAKWVQKRDFYLKMGLASVMMGAVSFLSLGIVNFYLYRQVKYTSDLDMSGFYIVTHKFGDLNIPRHKLMH